MCNISMLSPCWFVSVQTPVQPTPSPQADRVPIASRRLPPPKLTPNNYNNGGHSTTTNIPTLKTQRMMRVGHPQSAKNQLVLAPGAPGASGASSGLQGSNAATGRTSGASKEDRKNGGQGAVFLDEFYSFGAIRRLCARHMKKLEQEKARLKVRSQRTMNLAKEYIYIYIYEWI